MPWFALLGAVLVVTGTVTFLSRRGRAAGRPTWGEITADSHGLLELLDHIEQVDRAVASLGQGIDTVVPERRPGSRAVTELERVEVTRAYATAGDALVELSLERLGRDPSIVVARFVRLGRHVADDLDDGRQRDAGAGDDLLSWLGSLGDALRSDQVLLPGTPPPGARDLAGVVHELRRAVHAQLDALAPLLAPGRPYRARPTVTRRDREFLEQRVAEARGRVRDADAFAARGEMRAALAAFAAVTLPSTPDGPSTAFVMAAGAAAARLRRVATGYDAAVALLVDHASGLVDHHVGALVEVMTAAATERGRRQQAVFRSVLAAAATADDAPVPAS